MDRAYPAAAVRVLAKLNRPTDVAALVAFRIALGLLVAVGAFRFLANGWVERFFVQPTFFFKYWGFAWVKAWPAWGMHLHFVLLAVLGLCVAAGLFYRLSVLLCFVAFTYLELIDVSGYLNHYYLLSLLLLLAGVMPLGSAYSLDVMRAPQRRMDSFPAWCTYILRLQVALVYFFAGFAKFNPDWLLHGQPLAIWLGSRSDMPFLGLVLRQPWTPLAMSWGGFLFDTTVWIWLLWRPTRAYAYLILIVFHVLVGRLFNIGMFPFIMTSAALVFFEPNWPRRLLRRPMNATPVPVADRWRLRVGVPAGLLALFACFQLLFPLRFALYPGNVQWNEQGMRWSWRVMLREKNGAITYFVELPNGRRRIVTPGRYLTDFQEREMSGQPDLVLQLAKHIAAEFEAAGHKGVKVFADTRVSLNGRRSQPLVDPTVDLVAIEDGLAVAPWILQGPRTAPPKRVARR